MAIWSPEVNVDNVVSVDGSTVSVTNFPATQPVSGSVSVSNLPATQPVSGTVAVSNFPATQPISGAVTVTGTVSTTPLVSNTATVAQMVLTTNTNATLLAANSNRKKAIIFAPKITLYIKFGATASATSFTYIVTATNTTLEITNWTGQIDVFSTSGQTVNVTELV